MAGLISTTILRTQTDERLVALARAGHERAFEAIVERYRPELVRTLRRSMPAGSVDDVVQQTHLQAWKALTNGVEVHNLRGWLHRIARNAAIAASTRGYDYDELEKALLVSPGPEKDLEHREVIRRALRGIARLPERQRTALLEVAVAGRPHAEVAMELGVSETAVRQLVRRARVTLRTATGAIVPAPLVIWAAQFGSSSAAGEAAAGMGLAGVALKVGAVVVAVGSVATATPQVRDAIAQRTPSHSHSTAQVRHITAAHTTLPVAKRSNSAAHHTPAAAKKLAAARRTAKRVSNSWVLPSWGHRGHSSSGKGTSTGGQTTTTASASQTSTPTAAVGNNNRSSGATMLAAFISMMRAQHSTSSSRTPHTSHTSHTSGGTSTTASGPTTPSGSGSGGTGTGTTSTTPTTPATPTGGGTTTTTTSDQTPTTPATPPTSTDPSPAPAQPAA